MTDRTTSGPTRATLETSSVYRHLGQINAGMEVVDQLQVGDRMTAVDVTVS